MSGAGTRSACHAELSRVPAAYDKKSPTRYARAIQALVIVLSVFSIAVGIGIGAFIGKQGGFFSSLLALVFACGGFFFLVVAATGGLDSLF